jgi:hypothetical protein
MDETEKVWPNGNKFGTKYVGLFFCLLIHVLKFSLISKTADLTWNDAIHVEERQKERRKEGRKEGRKDIHATFLNNCLFVSFLNEREYQRANETLIIPRNPFPNSSPRINKKEQEKTNNSTIISKRMKQGNSRERSDQQQNPLERRVRENNKMPQ